MSHRKSLTCLVLGVVFALLALQYPVPAIARGGQLVPADGRSADGVWQSIDERTIPEALRRTDIAGQRAVLTVNRMALDQRLAAAPLERDGAGLSGDVIAIPLPDGRYGRFSIEESPILAPELAAAFPDIKTYRGVGLDDPTATARHVPLTGGL
jgi:hypothetical protein